MSTDVRQINKQTDTYSFNFQLDPENVRFSCDFLGVGVDEHCVLDKIPLWRYFVSEQIIIVPGYCTI